MLWFISQRGICIVVNVDMGRVCTEVEAYHGHKGTSRSYANDLKGAKQLCGKIPMQNEMVEPFLYLYTYAEWNG